MNPDLAAELAHARHDDDTPDPYEDQATAQERTDEQRADEARDEKGWT